MASPAKCDSDNRGTCQFVDINQHVRYRRCGANVAPTGHEPTRAGGGIRDVGARIALAINRYFERFATAIELTPMQLPVRSQGNDAAAPGKHAAGGGFAPNFIAANHYMTW